MRRHSGQGWECGPWGPGPGRYFRRFWCPASADTRDRISATDGQPGRAVVKLALAGRSRGPATCSRSLRGPCQQVSEQPEVVKPSFLSAQVPSTWWAGLLQSAKRSHECSPGALAIILLAPSFFTCWGDVAEVLHRSPRPAGWGLTGTKAPSPAGTGGLRGTRRWGFPAGTERRVHRRVLSFSLH